MATLLGWIQEVLGGEVPEAVLMGHVGGWKCAWEDRDRGAPIGRVLTWDEAIPHLQYAFHDGYGGAQCHALAVYTATRILSVSQYDGSTSLFEVMRHPVEHLPDMPGGG